MDGNHKLIITGSDSRLVRIIMENIKIYGTPGSREPMHAKALMFLAVENADKNILIVGSSNLTYSGLITNTEWNVLVKGDTEILSNALQKFINYWEHESFSVVRPNKFQAEALHKLSALRKERINKGLVIAATGVGKTFLAAFDVKQTGYRRILFLAHRRNILEKSLETLQCNGIIQSGTL